MIPSKKKKVHQRVHHYTLSTTETDRLDLRAQGACSLLYWFKFRRPAANLMALEAV